MVSVAVSTLIVHFILVFIDPGVKINDAYYRDVLMAQHPLYLLLGIWPEKALQCCCSVPTHRAMQRINNIIIFSATLWIYFCEY